MISDSIIKNWQSVKNSINSDTNQSNGSKAFDIDTPSYYTEKDYENDWFG